MSVAPVVMVGGQSSHSRLMLHYRRLNRLFTRVGSLLENRPEKNGMAGTEIGSNRGPKRTDQGDRDRWPSDNQASWREICTHCSRPVQPVVYRPGSCSSGFSSAGSRLSPRTST